MLAASLDVPCFQTCSFCHVMQDNSDSGVGYKKRSPEGLGGDWWRRVYEPPLKFSRRALSLLLHQGQGWVCLSRAILLNSGVLGERAFRSPLSLSQLDGQGSVCV